MDDVLIAREKRLRFQLGEIEEKILAAEAELESLRREQSKTLLEWDEVRLKIDAAKP